MTPRKALARHLALLVETACGEIERRGYNAGDVA